MRKEISAFRHTQYAIYVVIIFAISCVLIDSAQGVVERFNLNRRWYYLFGATSLFAYLYVRPQIRRRLGSASGAQINWSTLYIAWLCSAMFYHLPSLESLGIDLRADLSILLITFLLSTVTLGLAAALHAAALALGWIEPWLAHTSTTSVVMLHAMNLALACSTYHSFCESGTEHIASDDAQSPGSVAWAADAIRRVLSFSSTDKSPWRRAVCERWLAPMPAAAFPAFGSWVIYADENTGGGSLGREQTISPVFSLWLTLTSMVAVTCLADYSASSIVHQASVEARLKEAAACEVRRASRKVRRRSVGSAYDLYSKKIKSKDDSDMVPARSSFDVLMRTMSSVGNLWSPRKLKAASSLLLFRDDFGLDLGRGWGGGTTSGETSPKTPDGSASGAAALPVRIPDDAPAPSFLPMFPWYSGTSADLLKTLFDLLVSVKLFLGRFDNRALQAAAAGDAAGLSDGIPQDGDGFTFEHLADRNELWFDFCADTGDGGDSTYSVARCLAAPSISVCLPDEEEQNHARQGATQKRDGPRSTGDDDEQRLAKALEHGQLMAKSEPDEKFEERRKKMDAKKVTRVLPRGKVLLHGGDLAYPNPTEETYRTRLFSVYEAALPPPHHARRGTLVVSKPDVGRGLWIPPPRCLPGCPRRQGVPLDGIGPGPTSGPLGSAAASASSTACALCRKAAALRRYEGPSSFAIPGNHDWIDGLETFSRHILHRGWLGGWLLPQEKSYWALRLPCGWWALGLDIALVDDIDTAQYRYFARIAETRMGPDDRAVLILHCPRWLVDWFWGTISAANLRQLIRGPLRGRARVAIAGDLHFYMRHSFHAYDVASPAASVASTPAGASPPSGASPGSSRSPTPLPVPDTRGVSPTAVRARIMAQLSGFRSARGTANTGSQKHAAARGQQPKCSSSGGGVQGLSPQPLRQRASTSSLGGIMGASPRDYQRSTSFPRSSSTSLLDGEQVKTNENQEPPTTSNNKATPFANGSRVPPLHLEEQGKQAINGVSPPEKPTLDPLPALTPILTAPRGWRSRTPSADASDLDSDAEQKNNGRADEQADPAAITTLTSENRSSKTTPDGEPPPGTSNANNVTNLADGASPPAALGQEASSSSVFTPSWWPELRMQHSRQQQPFLPDASPRGSGDIDLSSDSSRFLSAMAGGNTAPGTTASSSFLAGGWRLADPEHLIVSGSGGAFLHPTHAFSYARFRPIKDPAAGPVFIKRQPRRGSNHVDDGGLAAQIRVSEWDAKNNMKNESTIPDPPIGEYRCQSTFPSAKESLELGKRNLHMFRNMNTRFDVIGGALYYLLVVSVIPRCGRISCVLDATSLFEGIALMWRALGATIAQIFLESYISLTSLIVLFAIALGFASTGGIGARGDVTPADRQKPELQGRGLAVRARLGGLSTRIIFAGLHTIAHVFAAVSLLLLLELGIETVIRYEHLGREGYHSLYKWYRAYEARHFPDPFEVRQAAERLTLGLYPNLIQWAMALYDIPESIAVARGYICEEHASLTRLQALGYYLGMLAYYWLLATPTVALLFGAYLYACINWFGVHYDEAFSSLQVRDHKGFLRLHITRTGDLEIFSLGLDKVPISWREDPAWRESAGGGNAATGAGWKARTPSRWAAIEGRGGHLVRAQPPEQQLRVIDYIYVPRRREPM